MLRERPDGVELLVLVVPRASKNAIVGEHDGRLKVQITAPPVDGAANAALIKFLSKRLGFRRADIAVVAGETGRRKTLVFAGADVGAIAERLGR